MLLAADRRQARVLFRYVRAFAKAPGEVPVHPPETAGERLVEYLLRQEVDARAKAA